MGHTNVKLWIHLIWGTKRRIKFLKQETKETLFMHLRDENKIKGVNIKEIGGIEDHIHLLLEIHPRLSVSWVVQKMKGESSNWINKNKLGCHKFSWQAGYSAFSVSQSNIERVIQYISNQEKHHKKISFDEELEIFCKKHKIPFNLKP